MADSHCLPGPHQHLGAQHEAPDVRASEKCLKKTRKLQSKREILLNRCLRHFVNFEEKQ
jgi:hypothetical protein